MTPTIRTLALVVALAVAAVPATSSAFDPKETFAKKTFVLSGEVGGGGQANFEDKADRTGLTFWNSGIRFGWIPFGTSSGGPLFGALEVGLEPFFQTYLDPVNAHFAGLGLALKYHFLAIGRFVPYVELFGAAGGTDLRVREIDSEFTFLVHGGVGAEYFIQDRTALYAGYRLQHVSNGNTSSPNRGFESHTGVVGIAIFFP